ncbi:MAG: 5-methyltetrahydropteroyltriglutamate--homocysteine methyltransferase [Chloroflexota bacterium]|nr:5-methyltetrahydropteroyltriglutamate--homocysteine methyltransferase [Dehalococcoidia bacterium]MDW8253527.1 5-methyltetrahydropteroyltriglutamate--homocysteine methyltransferase [Chloroflexota bacterium]
MPLTPLATQLVGSYSKPPWLFARERYPFFREEDAWRPPPELRREAQDDATLLAIYDQEEAGLDIITDGEQRRGRFDLYFLRYGGIDTVRMGRREFGADRDTSGSDVRPEFGAAWHDPNRALAPRVFAPVRWERPLAVEDLRFLQRHTDRPTKMTVLGPLTSACRVANEYYDDFAELVLDFAVAVNAELRALQDAGAQLLQLDEPDLFLRRTRTLPLAEQAINRALEGITVPTVVHLCHGYPTSAINKRVSQFYGESLAALAKTRACAISLEWEEPGYDETILNACGDKIVVLGVLNLGVEAVETVDHVLERVRAALRVVPPERLSLAPDCGLWHLPRAVAFRKIRTMALAAQAIRAEVGL